MSGLAETAERAPTPPFARVRLLDVLLLTNLAVLGVVYAMRYRPRLVRYRGTANLDELLLYAAALSLAAAAAWLAVRRRSDIDAATLCLVQVGLLLHWLGGLVTVDGGRLYDVVLAGPLRFDKLVHFVNGGITVAVLLRATPLRRARLEAPVLLLVAVLTTLGLATVVELVELGVDVVVPGSGTGGAADAMPDLLAGFLGSLCALPLVRSRRDEGTR